MAWKIVSSPIFSCGFMSSIIEQIHIEKSIFSNFNFFYVMAYLILYLPSQDISLSNGTELHQSIIHQYHFFLWNDFVNF